MIQQINEWLFVQAIDSERLAWDKTVPFHGFFPSKFVPVPLALPISALILVPQDSYNSRPDVSQGDPVRLYKRVLSNWEHLKIMNF